jgi:hypothetical protein
VVVWCGLALETWFAIIGAARGSGCWDRYPYQARGWRGTTTDKPERQSRRPEVRVTVQQIFGHGGICASLPCQPILLASDRSTSRWTVSWLFDGLVRRTWPLYPVPRLEQLGFSNPVSADGEQLGRAWPLHSSYRGSISNLTGGTSRCGRNRWRTPRSLSMSLLLRQCTRLSTLQQTRELDG